MAGIKDRPGNLAATSSNAEGYTKRFAASLAEPEAFWQQQALQYVDWFKAPQESISGSFVSGDLRFFEGGELNACYNCLDRHLAEHGDKTALVFEANEPNQSRTMSFKALQQQVCQFANVLKKLGIEKGDRVGIYLPMIPEAVMAMLACARIGAIHTVVFAGFSAESLKSRLQDAECRLVITADGGLRGEKSVALKEQVDQALLDCPLVEHCLVVQHRGNSIPWNPERDRYLHLQMATVDTDCPCEVMQANDPLFILYTSGSTGKPKGILHSTGGYLVYASMSHAQVFDPQPEDVYWCTADIGWITGHSYLVYGPLSNASTTLVYEGVPHYPDFSRYWQIIDRHQVSIFYTAPTAIRSLRKEGDSYLATSSRSSLRLLGSVGEPINPEVWDWYFRVVGQGRCPVVDTWWQTETGGILISPIPGSTEQVPGSASKPLFGIKAVVVNDQGEVQAPNQAGKLLIQSPWPGLMLSVYKDHRRFMQSYFSDFPGAYFTGDTAVVDEKGNFWIRGRNDDVIKISGHRLGSGELESALLTHPAVSEAAVVGIADALTGEAIYAYVTVKSGQARSDALKQELVQRVRAEIGPIASIKTIQWADALPKTRSGKIMRRILRKIAEGEWQDLGDVSTLADASVIEELISKI